MPFSNINNEEVYDSFTMEGKWRTVLARMCVRDMWDICKVTQNKTAAFCALLQCVGLERQEVDKWTLVYFQTNLATQEAVKKAMNDAASYVCRYFQRFKIQNLQKCRTDLFPLRMQVFSLMFQATCAGELGLQGTSCEIFALLLQHKIRHSLLKYSERHGPLMLRWPLTVLT